jgi:hypothetical protein
LGHSKTWKMKPLFVVPLMLIILLACHQVNKDRRAPDNIVSAFKKLHPNAVIEEWNDEPPVWEAKYKDGDEKGAVSFDKEAIVTETELVIEESQLRNQPTIPDYIKAHYTGEKIQRCERITKADGTTTYEIQITGKEIVFDKEGKYLSEEID